MLYFVDEPFAWKLDAHSVDTDFMANPYLIQAIYGPKPSLPNTNSGGGDAIPPALHLKEPDGEVQVDKDGCDLPVSQPITTGTRAFDCTGRSASTTWRPSPAILQVKPRDSGHEDEPAQQQPTFLSANVVDTTVNSRSATLRPHPLIPEAKMQNTAPDYDPHTPQPFVPTANHFHNASDSHSTTSIASSVAEGPLGRTSKPGSEADEQRHPERLYMNAGSGKLENFSRLSRNHTNMAKTGTTQMMMWITHVNHGRRLGPTCYL